MSFGVGSSLRPAQPTRSQFPQRVELRDIARRVEAGADHRRAAGSQRRSQGVAQRLLSLHDCRVAAESVAKLLPVHAADPHAVTRDALDLLLDADEADL